MRYETGSIASCGGVTIKSLKNMFNSRIDLAQVLTAIHPTDKSGVFLQKRDKTIVKQFVVFTGFLITLSHTTLTEE